MGSETVWITAIALVGTALLTLAVRKVALARGLVDVPNARSSHKAPTARGGGIAIVLVTTAALLFLALRGTLAMDFFLAVAVGGLAVAAIGLADDKHPVPSRIRLIVHFGAAIWAIAWLGGLPSLRFGAHFSHTGLIGNILGVLAIVWVLNLFNFMDGIDGIATSEALFVVLGATWLTAAGWGTAAGTVELVLAAACAGFLLWNWPPAKIFLGDVGSGYLGYVVGVLALAAGRTNPVAVWVWLILGGAFFVDATVTLVLRMLRGERAHEAHRSHAYQWLARRWRSHPKVTVGLLVLNLAWLLPCAILASRYPAFAAAIVVGAFVPLGIFCVIAGSGRLEEPGVAQP